MMVRIVRKFTYIKTVACICMRIKINNISMKRGNRNDNNDNSLFPRLVDVFLPKRSQFKRLYRDQPKNRRSSTEKIKETYSLPTKTKRWI